MILKVYAGKKGKKLLLSSIFSSYNSGSDQKCCVYIMHAHIKIWDRTVCYHVVPKVYVHRTSFIHAEHRGPRLSCLVLLLWLFMSVPIAGVVGCA